MYAWVVIIGTGVYVIEMKIEEGRDGRKKEDKI